MPFNIRMRRLYSDVILMVTLGRQKWAAIFFCHVGKTAKEACSVVWNLGTATELAPRTL
jgi:hypothetical protein